MLAPEVAFGFRYIFFIIPPRFTLLSKAVMNEVDKLEGILERENEECGDSAPSGKSIELRGSIKKVMADPKVIECLDRLEVQGEPVWGLSSSERDLIQMARQKVNDC